MNSWIEGMFIYSHSDRMNSTTFSRRSKAQKASDDVGRCIIFNEAKAGKDFVDPPRAWEWKPIKFCSGHTQGHWRYGPDRKDPTPKVASVDSVKKLFEEG